MLLEVKNAILMQNSGTSFTVYRYDLLKNQAES
jgi:hypothetical protein